MKIQILNINNLSNCIDGYSPVILENGVLNIDTPNNSVSNILMDNSIEDVPYFAIDDLLNKLTQLLRIGGQITITGIEINCLCRDFTNKLIDCNQFNSIIYNRKGMYDSNELSKKMLSLGLIIEKLILKGSTYELHASRPS